MPKQIILRNSAKCLKCNDEVESTHVHDFKWCKCGSMAVDGGHWYLKRAANKFEEVEDTSEMMDVPEHIADAIKKLPESKWASVCHEMMSKLQPQP
jgi:hypothetical protein